MAQLNFNAAAVQPASAFGPIPAGWYPAQITESEMKPTKNGDGAYLSLTFTILGGQYANRKIFGRLNLQNRNPVAVEIAEQQLSAICHATGVIQLQDSSQLHGIPLDIKIKVRAEDGTYEATNELSGFRALQQAAPAVGGGAPVATAQPGVAPWATQTQAVSPAQQAVDNDIPF